MCDCNVSWLTPFWFWAGLSVRSGIAEGESRLMGLCRQLEIASSNLGVLTGEEKIITPSHAHAFH